jgi:hypothetical protein
MVDSTANQPMFQGCSVCDRCEEIDIKIARYERLRIFITDQQTLHAADTLLDELKTEKQALHIRVAASALR